MRRFSFTLCSPTAKLVLSLRFPNVWLMPVSAANKRYLDSMELSII